MNKQNTDQFRAFFPIKPKAEDHSRISSSINYSQSQEFRSQTQTQQTSFGSSGKDSQTSLPRYEDLLASGRHADLKESLNSMNKNVISLIDVITRVETTLISHGNKIDNILCDMEDLKSVQHLHQTALHDSCRIVQEIRDNQYKAALPLVESDPVSPMSEGGISLTEYLNVKRMRIARTPTHLSSDRDSVSSGTGDDTLYLHCCDCIILM